MPDGQFWCGLWTWSSVYLVSHWETCNQLLRTCRTWEGMPVYERNELYDNLWSFSDREDAAMPLTTNRPRWYYQATKRHLPHIKAVMQDYQARDQCKRCVYGRYTKYRPDVGYQLIKCGVTNEIPIYYEKCDNYVESLPILGPTNSTSGRITQSGKLLTLDIAGNIVCVPCKRGRLPIEQKNVRSLGDCYWWTFITSPNVSGPCVLQPIVDPGDIISAISPRKKCVS